MRPLIHLDLELSAFTADWKHCDEVANYLARTVSLDRSDAFLYANLLSTVLNELLEIVFFEHRSEGALRISLLREGTRDRLELLIPAGDAQRDFYRRAAAAAQTAGVGELYTRTLLGEGAHARSIGLLELAADYGATISVDETAPAGLVRLVLEVTLEEGRPAALAT